MTHSHNTEGQPGRWEVWASRVKPLEYPYAGVCVDMFHPVCYWGLKATWAAT